MLYFQYRTFFYGGKSENISVVNFFIGRRSVISINGEQPAEINEIVDSILSIVPAVEIYLFGSFANGTQQEDSDYDIYVVIPDDSGMRELEVSRIINKKVTRRTRGIDMLVGTQSKFYRRKNYFYSIENEVAKTGVKLHG
jgi:predicted nucleotidyltransferase